MISEERFSETSWKMSYDEYKKCSCSECDKKDCIHRNAYRRMPIIDGGLGLCPNLKKERSIYMSKLYILCELNDENYTDAQFSFYRTYGEAKNAALNACKEWNEKCRIESREFKIIGSASDSAFYVAEIKQLSPKVGTHLLIWHHGYDGVDFEIRFQGTYDECQKQRKREINYLMDKLDLAGEDICDNVVDTGDEWEVFDIVEIRG